MDNLLSFLRQKLNGKLITSGENIDLLVWGMRNGYNVDLLGISLVQLTNINTSRRSERLKNIGIKLSQLTGLKFIEIQYPDNLLSDQLAKLKIEGRSYSKEDASMILQNIWQTSLTRLGTTKEVNRQTSDVFHAWARGNLPTSYVRIDLDAILTNGKDDLEIYSLIEVKRSTRVDVKKWNPFAADIRNYYLEYKLASLAGTKFYTLNHGCKSTPVNDNTHVGLHNIMDINLKDNKIISDKNIMTANEVALFLNSLTRPPRRIVL